MPSPLRGHGEKRFTMLKIAPGDFFEPRVLIKACLSAIKKATLFWVALFYGGEAGIRTLGRDKPTPVFKTGAFDHSATSPVQRFALRGGRIHEKLLKNQTQPQNMEL